MPLIEKLNGEGLIVGRIGMEYIANPLETYMISSEIVSSDDYNVAVYVDSICDNKGNPVKSSDQVNSILSRVEVLMKQLKVKGRYFRDSGEIISIDSLNENGSITEASSEIHKLEEVIHSGDLDQFKQILLENPSLQTSTNFGLNNESLLHYLSKKGLLAFCTILLDLGVDVNLAGKNMETPLVRAAHNGHLEVVKLLIKYGAHVDGLEEGVATPLIASAASGHEEVVYFLLERGANRYRRDKELNQSALEIAKNIHQESVVEIINSF